MSVAHPFIYHERDEAREGSIYSLFIPDSWMVAADSRRLRFWMWMTRLVFGP